MQFFRGPPIQLFAGISDFETAWFGGMKTGPYLPSFLVCLNSRVIEECIFPLNPIRLFSDISDFEPVWFGDGNESFLPSPLGLFKFKSYRRMIFFSFPDSTFLILGISRPLGLGMKMIPYLF